MVPVKMLREPNPMRRWKKAAGTNPAASFGKRIPIRETREGEPLVIDEEVHDKSLRR